MIRGEKFCTIIGQCASFCWQRLFKLTHHFRSPLHLNSRGSLNEMLTCRKHQKYCKDLEPPAAVKVFDHLAVENNVCLQTTHFFLLPQLNHFKRLEFVLMMFKFKNKKASKCQCPCCLSQFDSAIHVKMLFYNFLPHFRPHHVDMTCCPHNVSLVKTRRDIFKGTNRFHRLPFQNPVWSVERNHSWQRGDAFSGLTWQIWRTTRHRRRLRMTDRHLTIHTRRAPIDRSRQSLDRIPKSREIFRHGNIQREVWSFKIPNMTKK